jgi:glycosyltransferase involved in cell wall biosynthesis
MENLTVVIPFWNGFETIGALLESIPDWLPVIVVDDMSDQPLHINRENTRVLHLSERGYFSGAVNAGARTCETDILVLNQDARLEGTRWLDLIAEKRQRYAVLGDGVMRHPAWPNGYVQGTFMYIRRNAWEDVGELNQEFYPLWGATCEWQLRACRKEYKALPLETVPGLVHGEGRKFRDAEGTARRQRFGDSIMEAIRRERDKFHLFVRTPPMVSLIVPCYNYGHLLPDAINSLLGGPTCLGEMPGQTFQSFEIIIVDDASTDNSWEVVRSYHDRWKGIRAMRMPENRGLPAVLNHAIGRAWGKYINILSADDMREPWTVEKQLRTCLENPHSVAYGDIQVFKRGKRGKLLKMRRSYDFDFILQKNPMGAGIMFPKVAWEEVGGYPELMRSGREDWAFHIALAAAGWCGVHIDDVSGLYRRDGQNRSLRTSNVHSGEVAPTGSKDWRPFFRQQLRQLYPDYYQGVRPMGCCGGGGGRSRGGRRATASVPRSAPASLPGKAGMEVLEYHGQKSGASTYWGDVTKTPYRFGLSRSRGYVDVQDVPGFLNTMEGRKPVFRKYVARKPRPAPKPEPVKPEPVDFGTDSEIESLPTEIEAQFTSDQHPTPDELLEDGREPCTGLDGDDLTDIKGVGVATAEALVNAGYGTFESLGAEEPEVLADKLGMSSYRAKKIIYGAQDAI